ncbi:uncharacterized protein LOC110028182 [Phalaenopsis equestris]|uniref:uncharacterized protein LOC110028182 n=1 Tax=Phalaenopsis equestris TaxID=78828 RepID=UPI0009E4C589|nr:uncharacterized protein LOC110028182 [Phalaenopsis equestris]
MADNDGVRSWLANVTDRVGERHGLESAAMLEASQRFATATNIVGDGVNRSWVTAFAEVGGHGCWSEQLSSTTSFFLYFPLHSNLCSISGSDLLILEVGAAPTDVAEQNVENVEGRRNVDPLCGYASNPYHKCTDFCARKNSNQKISPKRAKSEGRKEGLMTVNTNNVNPTCSYASNPYHQCTKYCSQRTKKKTEVKQGKLGIAAFVSTERGSRGLGVRGRKNVDPKCKYASNPYHKCSSHCSLKINQMT